MDEPVTSLIYLAALLFSTACMLLLDWRHRLFFWRNPAAAALVLLAGVAFLLVWDAAGIMSGVFFHGGATIDTGIMLAPEMPLEEPFFLAFLVLFTMILYTGLIRLLARVSRPTA